MTVSLISSQYQCQVGYFQYQSCRYSSSFYIDNIVMRFYHFNTRHPKCPVLRRNRYFLGVRYSDGFCKKNLWLVRCKRTKTFFQTSSWRRRPSWSTTKKLKKIPGNRRPHFLATFFSSPAAWLLWQEQSSFSRKELGTVGIWNMTIPNPNKHTKSWLFEDQISNGLVCKGSGYNYSYSPNHLLDS